ncbi:hypothetical protein PGT21_027709 [Puccinia graminis f. sp. tritici]|uniref:Uncharacterized protein n=1 Tax=Puccinia graminis f. sp. tritici TaxID=56615 RepID=A0A5B0MGF7_PUCGR|nr:hypothetical protein PGTUg99_018268 [Puccinia graminis f. sp. tritici]KAA1091174.1 hypothetical protein PGT21_027709 [Puccinia graminis f. sp. tritici]
MKSEGSPCWRRIFFLTFLITNSLAIDATLQDPVHSVFTSTHADPRSLESSFTKSAARAPWPERPAFQQNPQSHSLLNSNCHPMTVEKTTRTDEIRAVNGDEYYPSKTSKASASASKTEEEDEDARLLDDLIQCQLLAPSSARPLRTATDNRLHKRSLDSKQKCNRKRWRKIYKSIRKSYNRVRRRMIIWLIKFLLLFDFKPARKAMRKVKLAQFFRVNCELLYIYMCTSNPPKNPGCQLIVSMESIFLFLQGE